MSAAHIFEDVLKESSAGMLNHHLCLYLLLSAAPGCLLHGSPGLVGLIAWAICANHCSGLLGSYDCREIEVNERMQELVPDIRGSDKLAAGLLIECRGQSAEALQVPHCNTLSCVSAPLLWLPVSLLLIEPMFNTGFSTGRNVMCELL